MQVFAVSFHVQESLDALAVNLDRIEIADRLSLDAVYCSFDKCRSLVNRVVDTIERGRAIDNGRSEDFLRVGGGLELPCEYFRAHTVLLIGWPAFTRDALHLLESPAERRIDCDPVVFDNVA